MYLRLFIVISILIICISGACGTNVITNSVTTAAGSMSYSIDYSGSGIVQNAPVENLVANDNFIQASITGCSIHGASEITGHLDATAANGNTAKVSADIDGPGASVTNYNLYGYVQPESAWAGQYLESARGTNMQLDATGVAGAMVPLSKIGEFQYDWAGSFLLTHPSSVPVYTVSNWYQDAMSGGSGFGNTWAMADIYSGKAEVQSADSQDWVDVYTGGERYRILFDQKTSLGAVGANEWVPQNNFIKIDGQSIGYANYNIGYSNVDGEIAGNKHVYTYWYKTRSGIDQKDVIYW